MKINLKLQRFLFWIACIGLTFSLFSVYEFYVIRYNKGLCIGIFLLSSILMIVGCPEHRLSEDRKKRMMLSVIFAAGLLFSFKSISLIVPFAFLLVGSVAGAKGKWFRKAYAAGECMLLQTVVFEIIYKFAAKVPHTKAFNYLFYGLTKLIGLDSSILNHDLYVRNAEQSLHFDITLDALGIYFLLVVLIPYVFFLCIGNDKDKKNVSKAAAISISYLLIRELALICLTFFYGSTEVYWSMNWLACSFLPFVFLMAVFTEMKQEELPVSENSLNKKTKLVIAGATVSFFVLCVLWTMDDPGISKSRRVLIDEWHCDGWESVEEHLDKENYGGQRSVYTYTSLVEWFRDMNMPVTINKDKELTFDLSEYDIVVLKTPQKEYTREEIANIRKYVENGGGLFVVGDHTNLFGMSDYFNALLKDWNITFEKDATYNVQTTNLSVYEPRGLFQDSIAAPMEYYKFATSCSIKSGLGVKSVITGYGLCSEQMDISHINFFNNMIPETHDKWGMFEQCVKKDVKKGRVVVWSDSTTFSSFSVFMHNNPELILGIVEYLARENTTIFTMLRVLALIAFVAFLAVLIWQFISAKEVRDRYQSGIKVYSVVSIPLCLVIASFVSGRIDFHNYGQKVLNSLDDQQMVYFVTENNGDYFSNFIGDFSWNQQENYSNFFIMFQRLGLYNREVSKIPENLEKSALALVVMNPTESMSKKELNNLENYVKAGGTVIVCDRGDYSDNTLLEHFDILKSGVIQSVPVDYQSEDGTEKSVTTLTQTYNAYGSWKIVDAITNDKFIDLIAYRIACGNGSIYVLSDSYILSNAWLGDPGMAPTQQQYETMNSIYDMLEKMIPMS